MNNFYKLTDREYDVLKLLAEGYSNSEIANILIVTKHTVKAHIASIYEKTGIHSRVVLAVRAVKSGIINIEYLSL